MDRMFVGLFYAVAGHYCPRVKAVGQNIRSAYRMDKRVFSPAEMENEVTRYSMYSGTRLGYITYM
jgi:hypothetical protein